MSAQDAVLRWGGCAAEEFGYPAPSPAWAAATAGRLGGSVLSAVLTGVADGAVELVGPRFRLPALGAGKGPYAWFSRSARAVPAPNWEYFVQVATWLQLSKDLPPDFVVGFEDGLMDVSVRVDGAVVWCVEVKERAAQLRPLLHRLTEHGRHVDLTSPDRSNDPLRKAKYVVRYRPQWFSLVAGDEWSDHRVQLVGEHGFALHPVGREDVLRSLTV